MDIEYSNIIKKSSSSVFIDIENKVKKLREEGSEIFDCSILDHGLDVGIPNIAFQSINLRDYKYCGYPGNVGEDIFIDAVHEYLLKNFDLRFDKNTEINITNGTKTDEFIFTRALVNHGDTVICPKPAYPGFLDSANFFGANVYISELKESYCDGNENTTSWMIDFESIPEDIAKKAKLIWYNYPNSPTGAIPNMKWVQKFVAWAAKYNIVIVSDEVYSDFSFGKKHVSPLHITKNGVIGFFSLSKRSNMTSMRVGFAVGDNRLIHALKKVKIMHDDGVPQLIQDMAVNVLRDQTHVDKLHEGYDYFRNKISQMFVDVFQCEKMPLKNMGGLFLWQKTPQIHGVKSMSGKEFANILLEKYGLVTMSGCNFSNNCCNYIRIAMSPDKIFTDTLIATMYANQDMIND